MAASGLARRFIWNISLVLLLGFPIMGQSYVGKTEPGFYGPGQLNWRISDAGYSTLARGKGNTIYVGSSYDLIQNVRDSQVMAYDSNGGVKWSYSLGAVPQVKVLATPDGVVSSTSNSIKAFDESGKLKWDLGSMRGDVSVGASGTLGVIRYSTQKIVTVSAISENGEILWSHDILEERANVNIGYSRGVAIASDNSIYLTYSLSDYSIDGGGLIGSYVLALTPEGNVKWQKTLPSVTIEAPVITPNGLVLVNSRYGDLGGISAFNQDGSVKWSTIDINLSSLNRPTVAENGTIYVGGVIGSNTGVYALNSDGSIKWYSPSVYEPAYPIVISGDQIIAIEGYSVFVLNAGNGSLRWQYTPDNIAELSPEYGYRGFLSGVGADNGYFYVGTRENGFLSFSSPEPRIKLTASEHVNLSGWRYARLAWTGGKNWVRIYKNFESTLDIGLPEMSHLSYFWYDSQTVYQVCELPPNDSVCSNLVTVD